MLESAPMVTSSRMARLLQGVWVYLAGPTNTASVGRALHAILFQDNAKIMWWLLPFRRKNTVDMAAAAEAFLTEVDVAMCRTDHGTEFVNESFARLCSRKPSHRGQIPEVQGGG